MKTNEVYLYHILDAICQIESYTAEINRDVFEADDMRQDAVIRQIEIIEEAGRQLSDDFQDEYTEVHLVAMNWRARAMNRLTLSPTVLTLVAICLSLPTAHPSSA